MKWQPIETAPRDGTTVIGWDGNRAFTMRAEEYWCEYDKLPGGGVVGTKKTRIWSEESCDALLPCSGRVTHWIPLPEALGE